MSAPFFLNPLVDNIPRMHVSRVYLRWYKSFNIDYTGTAGGDRVPAKRLWNGWMLDKREVQLPFVEIPIEPDVTTIVGANESGKSQLLSAISSVLEGRSIPSDPFSSTALQGREFSDTDLCHFAITLNKEANTWPQLGLEFTGLTRDEYKELTDVEPPRADSAPVHVFLIPGADGTVASVFHAHSDEPRRLSKEELAKVRGRFPTMHFINSQLPFADEVDLADLLTAYGETQEDAEPFYDSRVAQKVVRDLVRVSVPGAAEVAAPAFYTNIRKLQKDVEDSRARRAAQLKLEFQLFHDVLRIPKDAVKRLYSLGDEDAAHAAAIVSEWNEELERVLNLSRYWQQDQDFSIKLSHSKHTISFKITDKTQRTYSFRERSSGLRYFLSYYIQAKAIEQASAEKSHIVLMDEPDSFLSIAGQRNLLAVFESLVHRRQGRQLQLVYTTHSPFLIHRNFPRRIRLVRKGDGEEGTQLVDKARVRRFEPIRSALGIDLSQTLFMGAVNIITEGPTDQYFLAEAIRLFAPDTPASDLINLNDVVIVSGEAASQIYKVISTSKWADELVPTAIVILDFDGEGRDQQKRLIGQVRNVPAVVGSESVLFVNEFLEQGSAPRDATTEDLVPTPLFIRAVRAYLNRWLNDRLDAAGDLSALLTPEAFQKSGHAAATRIIFDKVRGTRDVEYDKLGVFEEVFRELQDDMVKKGKEDDSVKTDVELLRKRIVAICRTLRARIEAGTKTERQRTGVQAIRRLIGDFFLEHRDAPPTLDLELKLDRLSSEAQSFGADEGSSLLSVLSGLSGKIRVIRQGGRTELSNEDWIVWKADLEAIQHNPLNPQIGIPASQPKPPADAPRETASTKSAPVQVDQEKQASTPKQGK